MKKITTFAFYLITGIMFAQTTTFTIGNNPLCGSSTSSLAPANYNGFSGQNSWSSIIYKASDINYTNQGLITAISFIADCRSSACSFDTATNQKVYIMLTSANSFTSTNRPDANTMTKVFEGDVTWLRGTGSPHEWTTINLMTPFVYDGTSNLLIYFENNYDDALGGFFGCGESPSFLVNNLGDNAVIYARGYTGAAPAVGSYSNQTPLLQLTIDSSILSVSSYESINSGIYFYNKTKELKIINIEYLKLSIFTISGKLVKTKNVNDKMPNHTINLSTLNKGVYIVKARCSNGVITKKIVI